MNRKDFCAKFAETYEIPKVLSEDICRNLFHLLRESIENEERVYIKGLGTFKKKTIKAHRVGNVRDPGGEPVQVPEQQKVVFQIYVPPFGEPDDERDDELESDMD